MKSILSLFSLVLTVFASTAIAAGGGEHGGGHGGLTEKMNALFPPKQPKLEKRAVPAVPELSAPNFYSAVKGNKVTLNWNKIDTATEYHIQVSTEPTFSNAKNMVINDYHVKDTNFEVSNLEAGKHYYWRVAAVNVNNWSTFRKSAFASSMFETAAK